MKFKRLIATCLCGLLVMAMPITTFAAEEDEEDEVFGESGVCFAINIDDNIHFSSDDKIEVTLMNHEVQKEEIVEFPAKQAVDLSPVDLEEGYYTVNGVRYVGSDTDLQQEDIAITANFYADMDYDIVYLAIGDVSRERLMAEYYDVMMVSPDGVTELNGKVLGDHLSEAQKRERAEMEAGHNPRKEYKEPNVSKTEPEEKEEEVAEEAPEKRSRLWGLIPIAIIGVAGGVTLYVLKKKKIV